ncbi:hypothetical protein QF035_005496 [Streptomyces umbrinus]|uniref:Lipoprotein n=1 Tax=Streptomyces umbrinus TaxID=67370 RepID=A0ABU0SWI2_9ACTN|nr:hypothetical protein [Streptomyces umbrinus]MDQ1027914.1 hypothetical protein [Streptomyces umbrinus]
MTRPPGPLRPLRLSRRRTGHAVVPALAAAALLTTAGCSAGDGAGSGAAAKGDAAVSASPVAAGQAPSPSPSVTVAPTLTEAQVKSALISNKDLGKGWKPTRGGATWRDALLKGKTDIAECQRLLDGLYAEDLLGEPAGARAVRGLDDTDDGAQVRYQVGAYDRAALDASLAWLKEVPGKCGQFTATDVRGGELSVQVAATPLPGVGEARESLRMKVYGESGGSPAVLTLDFAAVRVGDSALSLTNGGLDGVSANSTRQAAQLGTQRLQDVLAGKKPAARPANEEADAEG